MTLPTALVKDDSSLALWYLINWLTSLSLFGLFVASVGKTGIIIILSYGLQKVIVGIKKRLCLLKGNGGIFKNLRVYVSKNWFDSGSIKLDALCR